MPKYPNCPNCDSDGAYAHGSVISTLRAISCDYCGCSTGWCSDERKMEELWTAISKTGEEAR